jgi:hypothetical protein
MLPNKRYVVLCTIWSMAVTLGACMEPRRDGSAPPVTIDIDAGTADAAPSDTSFEDTALPTPDTSPLTGDAEQDTVITPPDDVGLTCTGTTTPCGTECVDLQSSNTHCGRCDNPCSGNEVCENGQCLDQSGTDCRETACAGLAYCDLATGQCLPGCAFDDQCAGTNISCNLITRTCECDVGYHSCSGVCVDSSSVNTCGTRCSPCGDHQRCSGGECVCVTGYHMCNGRCVPNDSVDSCGTRCTPCPSGPAGTVTTCYQQTCGFSRAFEQFDTTGAYGCGVSLTGSLSCWGIQDSGRTTPPSGSNWTKVVTATSHACAIDNSANLSCWGLNTDGQTDVIAGLYTDVAPGDQHTCAITTSGSLRCWGRSTFNRTSPPSGSDYTQVVSGDRHSCALQTNNKVACWGSNGDNQTAAPTTVDFTRISAGRVHNCGLTTAGGVRCWGSNTFGQRAAPSGTDFVDISVNDYTSCALRANGHIACWGDQADQTPTDVLDIKKLVLGGGVLCALRTTNDIVCWGPDGLYNPQP